MIRASVPTWTGADVAGDWSLEPMDIWHDRAVFHFLTDPDVLADTLGRDLTLVETRRHVHTTPWGATPSFQ